MTLVPSLRCFYQRDVELFLIMFGNTTVPLMASQMSWQGRPHHFDILWIRSTNLTTESIIANDVVFLQHCFLRSFYALDQELWRFFWPCTTRPYFLDVVLSKAQHRRLQSCSTQTRSSNTGRETRNIHTTSPSPANACVSEHGIQEKVSGCAVYQTAGWNLPWRRLAAIISIVSPRQARTEGMAVAVDLSLSEPRLFFSINFVFVDEVLEEIQLCWKHDGVGKFL